MQIGLSKDSIHLFGIRIISWCVCRLDLDDALKNSSPLFPFHDHIRLELAAARQSKLRGQLNSRDIFIGCRMEVLFQKRSNPARMRRKKLSIPFSDSIQAQGHESRFVTVDTCLVQ